MQAASSPGAALGEGSAPAASAAQTVTVLEWRKRITNQNTQHYVEASLGFVIPIFHFSLGYLVPDLEA